MSRKQKSKKEGLVVLAPEGRGKNGNAGLHQLTTAKLPGEKKAEIGIIGGKGGSRTSEARKKESKVVI